MISNFEDIEDGIVDNTINGECINCGDCCSMYIPISSKEIKGIKRYIKKHNIKEQRHTLPVTTKYSFDITCPFRDDVNKKCLIYKVRPSICRDFLCNKSQESIYANRDLYYKKYKQINLRKEFFGS